MLQITRLFEHNKWYPEPVCSSPMAEGIRSKELEGGYSTSGFHWKIGSYHQYLGRLAVTAPAQPFPTADDEGLMLVQPLQILERLQILENGKSLDRVRVKWKEGNWKMGSGSKKMKSMGDGMVSVKIVEEKVEGCKNLSVIKRLNPSIDPWGQGSFAPGGIVMGSLTNEVEANEETDRVSAMEGASREEGVRRRVLDLSKYK